MLTESEFLFSFFIHVFKIHFFSFSRYAAGPDAYFRALDTTTTLYVGNLSFYTTEEQIYELFSTVGKVKVIIMGLDRDRKTPCGFCFVEYYERASAEACMKFLNGTMLDERLIRTDLDPGFTAERQYGRGASGGQVRDEYRPDYDFGRGGYGRQFQQREAPQAYTEFQSTAATTTAPPGAGFKRTRDDNASTTAATTTNASGIGSIGGGGGGGGGGAAAIGARDGADDGVDDAVEQRAKNPRFREQRDDDDE
jgi:nuclear cap-binding protein subunit 2